jgi:acylphosphatase
MTTARQVIYSGRVQGVGFRYTVRQLAAGRPVAGYVRNLRSGEVELWAEGAAEAVEEFLTAVASRMARYIRQATVREVQPTGESGFEVRATV